MADRARLQRELVGAVRVALRLAAGLGCCGLLLLSARYTGALQASAATPGGTLARQAEPTGGAENWLAHNADASESAYSRLEAINVRTIGRLGLAWSMDLPGETSLEATPLAVDGVLYFTGSHASVYAVDGATGRLLWKYDPQTWKFNPAKLRVLFPANRGVAYADGRVFAGARDGRLFALDAKTGKLLWSVETVAPDSPQSITGAPRAFNGKVIIGQTGADYGARGYVTAYDAATGKQAWRFYVTPGSPEQNRGDPAMERAAATWRGEYWKSGTGGGPWDSITFDPELNRIYIGAANAAPYDPELRSPGGGDNLYTASIVALDADTGKYVWHYQVNPRDSWDYDAAAQMTLADLVIGGRGRKVLMQAPKNGFFYVLDRQTGRLISAEKIGKATWADRIDLKTGRPVEARNIRYETGETIIWPSNLGAHAWQSMSFSPKTGLVYVPYMQLGVRFKKGAAPGEPNMAGLTVKAYKADPADGTGALIAWDPVRQRAAWTAPHDALWNGGAMATAGDLVFQGAADGFLSAYDARTGERLWRFYAGMGINAAPMSYAVGGRQYVSVLVGYGGSTAAWGKLMDAGWSYAGARRLLTFALDGKAVAPPSRARFAPIEALDDPSIKIDPAEVAAGRQLYFENGCLVCHGLDLGGPGGPGPDLRESRIAMNPDNLWAVVHDGALMPNGMPSFPAMTRSQLMQISAYIRSGARDLITARKTAGR
jgi:quinohemoprotein ethanol dehydrogenase